MFLFIIREIASNRAIQEKFQNSSNTIFYVFHEILTLLLYLHAININLPTKYNVLHPWIIDNTKYFPYFQDY